MIFALDTSATRTGWCLGAPLGPAILGHALFGGHGDNIGALLADFRDWLSERLDRHQPSLIAFEKPVRPMAQGNLKVFRQLYGIAGMVELVALDHKIPAYEVDNQQVKKLFYGSGGKKPGKADGLALAAQWGFEADNMDEADAAGVWMKTIEQRHPEAFRQWERLRAERMVECGARLL